MVKAEEVEDLMGRLNALLFALRRAELARTGKWRAMNPLTGREVEVDLKPEERDQIAKELADAMRAVRERINSIDWTLPA
jgi:hypothetical protein